MGDDNTENLDQALENLLPPEVVNVYREEQEFMRDRDEKANDRLDPWYLKVINFLDPLGLTESSNTSLASELPSVPFVERRAQNAVQQIEMRLGFTLDDETKGNIRADISNMWGRQIRPPE